MRDTRHIGRRIQQCLCLAPANPAARRSFATVHPALRRSGKCAIGRIVFAGKWQLVAVRPVEHVSLLHTLDHPARRRAVLNPEGGDVEVSRQDLLPVHPRQRQTGREVETQS
ncbi:MAG: hypothetical protein ABSG86_16770 [Thermoguttaceae bacterium]